MNRIIHKRGCKTKVNCLKLCEHFKYHSFFASGSNRKAIPGGTAEFTTFPFYEIPMVLREMLHPRVTILSVSPPDENGNETMEIRTIMPITFAFDHRAFDYGDCLPLFDKFDEIFENPEVVLSWK